MTYSFFMQANLTILRKNNLSRLSKAERLFSHSHKHRHKALENCSDAVEAGGLGHVEFYKTSVRGHSC